MSVTNKNSESPLVQATKELEDKIRQEKECFRRYEEGKDVMRQLEENLNVARANTAHAQNEVNELTAKARAV